MQCPQLDDHIGNGDLYPPNYCPPLDGDEVVEEDVVDLQYGKVWPTFKEPENTSQQFERHIVEDNAFLAASALVSRALFQSPDAINAVLPPPNIMLFLYIAKLMMSLGLHQQYDLSRSCAFSIPMLLRSTPTGRPYLVHFLGSVPVSSMFQTKIRWFLFFRFQ